MVQIAALTVAPIVGDLILIGWLTARARAQVAAPYNTDIASEGLSFGRSLDCWLRYAIDGARSAAIILVYAAPFLLLACGTLTWVIVLASSELAQAFPNIAVSPSPDFYMPPEVRLGSSIRAITALTVLSLLLGYITYIVTRYALIRAAVGTMRNAFELGEIVQMVRRTGTRMLLETYAQAFALMTIPIALFVLPVLLFGVSNPLTWISMLIVTPVLIAGTLLTRIAMARTNAVAYRLFVARGGRPIARSVTER